MITLTTPRLLMRQFLEEDAHELYLLNSDPEVLRFTGDAPFTSMEAARDFIRGYDQYALYQRGRLGMFLKEGGAYVGWCGLKYHPENDETELGFRLKREFWNRGYATEAALASLRYGFNELALPTIFGRVIKGNTASIRVLEKIGMRYWKDFDFEGVPGIYMRIDNKETQRR
jgi:RimJ/RimL family protein N-acetyltransferase